jgi:hypothetical protein
MSARAKTGCEQVRQGVRYSITSSAVARSKGEIVTLFQKSVSFNVPRDGWWVSDVWGALDGRIPPGLRVVATSHSLD